MFSSGTRKSTFTMSHHKGCPSTLMVQNNQLLQPIQNTTERWIKPFCCCISGRSDLPSKRKTLLEIFVSFPASCLSFRIARYLVGMLSPPFSSRKRNFRFSGLLQEAEYCNKEEKDVLTSTPPSWLWQTAYLQYIKQPCLLFCPQQEYNQMLFTAKFFRHVGYLFALLPLHVFLSPSETHCFSLLVTQEKTATE